MVIFYDVLKFIFLFLTIFVGIFYLRGEYLFQGQFYSSVFQILMPGYLLFAGLMVGYLVANIWEHNKTTEVDTKSIYIKSFIIGIVLGLILAFLYMFLQKCQISMFFIFIQISQMTNRKIEAGVVHDVPKDLEKVLKSKPELLEK